MRTPSLFAALALLVAAFAISPPELCASPGDAPAVQDPAPRPTPPPPPAEPPPVPAPPKGDAPLPPAPPQADTARGARMVARFDKDADGQLSKAELPEFLTGWIAELDKDGNGFLTVTELDAMPMPPRGDGPGMGPPDGMGGPGRGEGRGDGMGRAVFADPAQLFSRLDANQDGKVTKEELPERLAERLLAADLDKDGSLTLDELRQAGEKERVEQAKRTMERLDVNKDGKITRDEIPERMLPRLAGVDADQDGGITLTELSAPPPPRPEEMDAVRRDPAQMIARLDRNGDGKLAGDEIPGWMQRRMAQLDKNADGALTVEELGAAPPADPAPAPPPPPKKEGEPVRL